MCEREIAIVGARQHNRGEALMVLSVSLSPADLGGPLRRRQPIGENTYRVLAVVQLGEANVPSEGPIVVWDGFDDEGLPIRPASGIDLEPIPPGESTIVAYARPNVHGELMLGTYLICRGAT